MNDLMFYFGKLDFDVRSYFTNFNFSKGKRRKYEATSFASDNTKIKLFTTDLEEDDYFRVNISNYINNVLQLDYAEAGISYYPPILKNDDAAVTSWHQDTHLGYLSRHNLTSMIKDEDRFTKLARYWIPLTDSAFGHYFEITNGKERIIKTNWESGDVFRVFPNNPHIAANLGFNSSIKMIITGVIR